MANATSIRIDRRLVALYFPVVASLLLVMALGAFSDNLFTDVHQPSNSDPQMIVHGLFAALWVGLLAAQAWLVNLRLIAVHRKLGQYAFIVAGGMALSTAYLFYSRFKGFAAMEPTVIANRLLLPVFIVCAVLAWRNRLRPDWHKRLLLIGTLALQAPVLDRLYDPVIGWAIPVTIDKALDETLFLIIRYVVWAALVFSLWFYDRAVLGRIHPVTLWGSGAIASLIALSHLI